MAYTFDLGSVQEPISLEDYVEALEGLDLTEETVAVGTAYLLKRLAVNRTLLVDYVNKYLQSAYMVEDENPYNTQSFILYRCERFFVRANVWIRPRDYGGGTAWETRAFSYEAPHNHNFDFLTVNCLGGGYHTEIYDFDPTLHSGYVGEDVRLDLLENTRLDGHKVIYFRKFRDVHIQYAPEDELSVSLNLMISDSNANNKPQFEFDIGKRKITNIINTAYTGKKAFFNLVKHLGNPSTLDMLHSIGTQNDDPRVRAFAWDAAIGIGKDDALLDRLLHSKDDVMRRELVLLRTR